MKGAQHSLSSHQRVKERQRAADICYCVCLPTPVPGGFEVGFEKCIWQSLFLAILYNDLLTLKNQNLDLHYLASSTHRALSVKRLGTKLSSQFPAYYLVHIWFEIYFLHTLACIFVGTCASCHYGADPIDFLRHWYREPVIKKKKAYLPEPLRFFLTVLPVAPVTSSQIRTILPFSPAALIFFFSVPVHVFVILYNSLWSWESKGNLKPTRCFCCWRHRRQQGLSLTET